MVDGFHMHLGYEVAVSISHHGTNPHISALIIGPYITCLVCHMGAFLGTDRMRVVGGVAPMSLETQ